MTKSKITPWQFMTLLFISRIIVSLTYIPDLNYNQVSGDLLLSIVIKIPISILLYLPIYFYLKKFGSAPITDVIAQKNVGLSKFVGVIYALWFVFLASINVSRFVYFVTSELTTKTVPILFIVLVTFAGAYAAYMGVEGVARASFIVILLLFFCFGLIIAFNIPEFNMANFSPVFSNKFSEHIFNGFKIAVNTSEVTALLFLMPHIKGDIKKKFFGFFAAISAVVFLLYFSVIAVLGDFAKIQTYPIFALSQIAEIGIIERLDSFHTSAWIVAIVIKTSLYFILINTALKNVIKINKRASTIIIAVIVSAIAGLISSSFISYWINSKIVITIVLFVIFAVIIPALTLFLKKREEKLND